MKTARKSLLIALCAILLVVASVMGTLAYLTSTTGTVTNTFTVGNLSITLDEAKTDEYGVEASPEERVQANTYKLVPGHTYAKDPTVHVAANSEKCYVFVKVVDEITAIQDATTVANQITTNGWTALTGVDNVYYKVVEASTSAQDLVVFENFKIKTDAAVADYANKTIKITAYAIQHDTMTDANAAWTAGNFS